MIWRSGGGPRAHQQHLAAAAVLHACGVGRDARPPDAAPPFHPTPQVHPGRRFLEAHQQAAARKAGAMSLAERQLVSRAYARLQQLGEGAQGQQEAQQQGVAARGLEAGANSSWSSRPAATNWRRAPSEALSS
jgi:hypothetical protein